MSEPHPLITKMEDCAWDDSVGDLLRRARASRSLSSRDVAAQIGCSYRYVLQVEHNEGSPPTDEYIRKIAPVLGLDPVTLLPVLALERQRRVDCVTGASATRPAKVLRALRDLGGATPEAIAEHVDLPRRDVVTTLRKLVVTGQARKVPGHATSRFQPYELVPR